MSAHSRWSRKFSRTTARLAAEIGRSNPLMTANAASPIVTKQDKSSQSLPASPFGFSPSLHGMEGDIDRASISHGAASRASTAGVEPIAPPAFLSLGNDEFRVLIRSSWPSSIDLRPFVVAASGNIIPAKGNQDAGKSSQGLGNVTHGV